jgi:hypothetical protein
MLSEDCLRDKLRKLFIALCRRYSLPAHLNAITDKIIREEVHEATQDAEEIGEPPRLR